MSSTAPAISIPLLILSKKLLRLAEARAERLALSEVPEEQSAADDLIERIRASQAAIEKEQAKNKRGG